MLKYLLPRRVAWTFVAYLPPPQLLYSKRHLQYWHGWIYWMNGAFSYRLNPNPMPCEAAESVPFPRTDPHTLHTSPCEDAILYHVVVQHLLHPRTSPFQTVGWS